MVWEDGGGNPASYPILNSPRHATSRRFGAPRIVDTSFVAVGVRLLVPTRDSRRCWRGFGQAALLLRGARLLPVDPSADDRAGVHAWQVEGPR